MATIKKMLVEDWIKVADNPIQRDTEKHAAKAKHLRTPHPTHSVVHAAELPNGKLIKLDGHTRALMWKRKDIAAPMQVMALVYPAKDMDEVQQLYKDFDSKDALETQRDKVSGAFNRHNFDPQSGLLQSGSITFATRIAWNILHGFSANSTGSSSSKGNSEKRRKIDTTDIYTMIDEFSYELHALDGLKLSQGGASAGIVAAFLVSFRRHGHKITPFWTGVFGGTGNKTGRQMDAIESLCQLILEKKGRYGGQSSTDTCARALYAVEKHLKDETLFTVPKPLDTAGYLAGYEVPNERLIKRADVGKKK